MTAKARAMRHAMQAPYLCKDGVTDGIRTHNNRNHNPGLYL